MHRKNILIYIQQDAMLHSLFYLETALHVSGGTITHHQERKQLYLQYLVFVTPLLLRFTTGTSWTRERSSRQLNTMRTGSFKLFKRPFPGFLTILTL